MVRYHNSGTQKFDDTEHDSVSTDDASVTSVIDAPGVEEDDTGIYVSNLSVSDGEQANLSADFGGALIGELLVVKRISGTATARFSLEGGFGITELVDPTGQFGTTQGAQNINIYEGSDTNGDGRDDYLIENTGSEGDVVLSAIFIGSLTTDTSWS